MSHWKNSWSASAEQLAWWREPRPATLPAALSLVERRPATIANRLRPAAVGAPYRSERLKFSLSDGTGDTLLASLDQPPQPKSGAPLVILIHGLTGAEDSRYILSMARLLLERGRRVLRLNLRGA